MLQVNDELARVPRFEDLHLPSQGLSTGGLYAYEVGDLVKCLPVALLACPTLHKLIPVLIGRHAAGVAHRWLAQRRGLSLLILRAPN